ncbi:hypothetical protein Bca4012_085927 [Brassica carinata]|uniref:Glycine-rich protein n=1 Tax=Brassica carinata TaxID=52824 RepID=A0A8X7QMC4_BRACI|nr:hypothetical protein Bca52824_067650 [Brassica carinata]
MGCRKKASLLLYFLFLVHLHHNSFHAISAAPSHVSKPDSEAFAGKTAELAVVVKKGGGGGGIGGGGGGGRSFGGGGRSFGGGGGSKGGRGVVPLVGGAAAASHHRGHHSSGGRESASVWFGLLALLGLVLAS